jgi:primosomal protein N'
VHDERGMSLSFATTRGTRVFRSADGKTKKAAQTTCDVCGSWNLLPLGIGVERVAEEISKAIPEAKIIMLDTDTIRTPAQARKAAITLKEPGTIIIGTEFMLPFLSSDEKVSYAAIASADALLALPFWRVRERLVHSALTLRERSEKLSIATRRPDDSAFTAVLNPLASTFFEEEATDREAFMYPPYGHLVVVHAEGPAIKKETMAATISAAFADHPITRLPDRVQGATVRISIVAKYAHALWPDELVSEALAALPPWATIHIDSESLW